MGELIVPALRGIDLSIEQGEFIAVLGPSGSGKTTLLNLLGGIDRPTEGEIYFETNKELTSLPEKQLTKYRRNNVGFIFQFYNLVGSLTAFENVELVARLTHEPSEAKKISSDLLEAVGLGDKTFKFPAQLSGGLDSITAGKILKLFQKINKEFKVTIVIVTHNKGIASLANKIIYLRDGKIYGTALYDPLKEKEFWDDIETPPAIEET
jgi:putative ABC transport system ATP-binding protein